MTGTQDEPSVLMRYDVTIDETRPVTQEDVDHWQAVEQAFGATRVILRRILGFEPSPVPITDWKSEANFLGDVVRHLDRAAR